MILNNELKPKYWLLNKQSIIDKFEARVVYADEKDVELKEDTPFSPKYYVKYYGVKIPVHPVLNEDDTIREATDRELIEKGIYSLADHEVLVGDKATSIYSISGYGDLVKPKFDYEKLQWVETATPEEIEEFEFKDSVKFYNEELDFASKATAELACEIITPEMYEDVKLYMRAIDPYASGYNRKSKVKVTRPELFNKYN